mgnify:CR=1 FL=1
MGRAKAESERLQDSFEMQEGAIKPGQNVIVIDDLIATGELERTRLQHLQELNDLAGGSAFAAGELVTKCGGKVLEYLFIDRKSVV